MSRLMVRSHTERSTSVTGLSSRSEPPAQFSSTSTRPKASFACCTICLTLSSSVTSVATKRASAPASRALASPSVASSSATTTLAPSATNSLADARPMPEPAPVITATLPARRFIWPSPRYTSRSLAPLDRSAKRVSGETFSTISGLLQKVSPLGPAGLGRDDGDWTAAPLVDLLQRTTHQLRPVAVRQPIGLAERRDALLVGQHSAGSRPVRPPHAAVEAERVDDPQHRIPDVVVGERLPRQRAGAADLDPDVRVGGQRQQLRQIGPRIGGGRGWLGCSRPRWSMTMTVSGFRRTTSVP